MSVLKIALLGPPEVDHQDRRLTFPDRKVLALLAYLATEGGMQERQKLTRLLWPESDMAHGRATLRLSSCLSMTCSGRTPRESSHLRGGRRGVSYHFADDKIREVVYVAAGDARRRVFRSRAYFAGARGRHHRSAGLPLAREGIARSYVSVGYDARLGVKLRKSFM